MNTQFREYGHAANSLLRGRGLMFVALLTLGLSAGSIAVISQVGSAVLRPVTHVLGLTKSREECTHGGRKHQARKETQAVAAALPHQSEDAEATTRHGG